MDSTPASQVLAIPEILSMIINLLHPKSLYSASLVCKDWHRIVRLILWRQLVIPGNWYKLDLTQLWPALDRQGSIVKTLSLELTNAERTNRCTENDLIKTQLTSLLSKVPNLESLHIQFPHDTKSNIILAVAENATQLKRLDTDIKNWDPDDMATLLSACPNLWHIGGHSFTGKVLQAISASQPMLKRIDCNHPQFDDDELITFARHFPDLLQLSVSFHQFLTSKALIRIAESCKKIEQLEFHFCLCLQSEGFQSIFKAFSNLRSLNLGPSEVFDDDIALLAAHCPKLELLKLPFCSNITQTSILKITQSCRDLQHLDISWCDKVLLSVFNQKTPWVCKRLRYLDISGISTSHYMDHSITIDSLVSMYYQLSQLRELQHLKLSGHEFSLRLLEVGRPYLEQLTRLETLNISKLRNAIPWSDMIEVGNLFPRLRQFLFQNSDVIPPSSVLEKAATKKIHAGGMPSKSRQVESGELEDVNEPLTASPQSSSMLTSSLEATSPESSSPKQKRSQVSSPSSQLSLPGTSPDSATSQLPKQLPAGSTPTFTGNVSYEGEDELSMPEVLRATLNSGLEISLQACKEDDGWDPLVGS
ncbi:F-box and leucine-rich repeat protein 4, partial [Haplosporangium sp. Z 27]